MPNLKDCRVLVTPTSYALHDQKLRTKLESEVGDVVYNTTGKPLSSSSLREIIPGIDGYIAGLDMIDRAVIEVAGRLKVIARYGVGLDNIDLTAAKEKGIVVTNTPGANSDSVAELTIGLILSLARSIPMASSLTKAGEWPRMRGVSLNGKVVGLLGFGSIGKSVASRLSGFGCTILAYDTKPDQEYAESLGVKLTTLDEIIQESEFVSLHLPLVPETHAMVNADFLCKMKPEAFLINTSRGEIIDEAALAEALEGGRLRGAALDVFTNQPPEKDNPLLALPQVIATPHTGSHTDGAVNAMGWLALEDCLAVLRGEAPQYPVLTGI
jgi:D-3-phosphoglycerate dehydrogenase